MIGEALPEGVEAALTIYLTSDDGVDMAVSFRGFSHVPDFDAVAAKANKGPGWRRMTRAEIEVFKANAEDDDD